MAPLLETLHCLPLNKCSLLLLPLKQILYSSAYSSHTSFKTLKPDWCYIILERFLLFAYCSQYSLFQSCGSHFAWFKHQIQLVIFLSTMWCNIICMVFTFPILDHFCHGEWPTDGSTYSWQILAWEYAHVIESTIWSKPWPWWQGMCRCIILLQPVYSLFRTGYTKAKMLYEGKESSHSSSCHD